MRREGGIAAIKKDIFINRQYTLLFKINSMAKVWMCLMVLVDCEGACRC